MTYSSRAFTYRHDSGEQVKRIMDHEEIKDDLGNLDLKFAFGLTDLLHEEPDRVLCHVL